MLKFSCLSIQNICFQNQCETYECNKKTKCNDASSKCIKHFCSQRTQCTDNSDCSANQICSWGQCFDVIASCSSSQQSSEYGVVQTWTEPPKDNKCSPPLKCIDGFCRPHACFSKKDCDTGEDCLKWSAKKKMTYANWISGICCKMSCTKSIDCLPGYSCKTGICIRNFCSHKSDCAERYHCVQGSCILESCKIDFECGARCVCREGACLPAVPYGWKNRPCRDSYECFGSNLQCFKTTEIEKYGKCVPYMCQEDIDCPYWMTCKLGICKYTKCSPQNPCSPGLICAKEFCFFHRCFSTYHCPPNHECIAGRCTLRSKICYDNSHCDNSQMCKDNICYTNKCEVGYEEEDCPLESTCLKKCQDKECRYGVCSDPCLSGNCKGLCILGRCYDPKCDQNSDCPYLYVCKNNKCVSQITKNNLQIDKQVSYQKMRKKKSPTRNHLELYTY